MRLVPGTVAFACHSAACRPPGSGGTGGSTPKYFHASPHEFKPGTILKPQSMGNFTDGTGHGQGVSLTDSVGAAEEWAIIIGASKHPKMHVYEVRSIDPPKKIDSGFYGLTEHVAPSVMVVRKIMSINPDTHET